MIEIRHGDRGPEVVAVQCLVNRSRPANVLNVDGVFLDRTRAAVIDLQRRSGINPPNGVVGYRTWQELARSPPVSVVNAVDIYDPAQGEAIPPSMRAAPGLIATGGLSNGVAHVLRQIGARARSSGPIALLRFFGHGRSGLMAISAGTGRARDSEGQVIRDAQGHTIMDPYVRDRTAIATETWDREMEMQMRALRSAFAPFGSAELHCCHVGQGEQGRNLLGQIAQAFGVPVSAGVQPQSFGPRTASRFEGPAVTVFPRGGTLQSWAAQFRVSR
jgi:peptidoglycan hydrolase-like protein with peptidoglycan-binding domain